MLDGIVPLEIREGPAAIRATVSEARADARRIASAWRARGVRRIHVIGNGTSYHSCLAAATLYRRHAGPDDPVVVPLTAADLLRYPPRYGDGEAIIGISSSGEFKDVLAVTDAVKGRVPVAGIVSVPDSTLTRTADEVVLAGGGVSAVPVMTKTFSSTLAATELLLLQLLGDERAAAPVAGMLRAADAAEAAVAAAEALVEPLADRLRAVDHIFVTGGGAGAPAAMEAALKLKEMALVHAEGSEVWEMTSGASTMLGPGAVVIALAPEGPARSAIGELLQRVTEWGAGIVEVGPARLVQGSSLLPLPADAEEDHASLCAVPPVALLAFALARARGANPDRPGWIERYHSQGLRHILGAGEGGEA